MKPRAFTSFRAAADEAGISRLYGGIHFRAAIERGLEQGRCIARLHERLADQEVDHASRRFRPCPRRIGPAALRCRLLPRIAVAIPSFVEETASAGIDSVYAGEWEYMVGGGVATFDCNGDGFADMLLAGGEQARQILPQRQHTWRCACASRPRRAVSNWTR